MEAVSRLVEWMAVDDPPVPRRQIVDLLALAGRRDVGGLAVHLADPRWFVVRNVCIALGRTGLSQAIEPVMSALDHDDDRVRVEALRALSSLQGEASVSLLLGALRDPSRRVRQAVASLLRASPSRLVVPGLVDVIEAGTVGSEQAVGLVELIAERRDDSVARELERLASMKRALGGRRAVREAARRALAQRAS
jgi:HEAT repeat protein